MSEQEEILRRRLDEITHIMGKLNVEIHQGQRPEYNVVFLHERVKLEGILFLNK